MLLPLYFMLAGGVPSWTVTPADVPPREVQTPACPADDAHARANVDRFMTSSTFAADLQRLGIDGLTPANVRVLKDSTDAAVCKTLNDAVHLGARPYPRLKTYYTAANYYLIPTITVVPPDHIYISFEPLLILDKTTLRPVDSFAM